MVAALDARGLLLKGLVVLILAIYLIKSNYFILSIKQDVTLLLSTIFFPRDMDLYVVLAAAAAWGYFLWRRPHGSQFCNRRSS